MPTPAPVQISDYDPRWPEAFAALHRVLAAALGPLALAIEHVGSTAVPGLPAKPILDIDVVITPGTLSAVVQALAALGYQHQGDLGIPGREAFNRLTPDVPHTTPPQTWPEHHLYACPANNPELRRHLAFRDYLRTHPAQAQA